MRRRNWPDEHDITGVPTLMLFRGGKVIDRMVGLSSVRALKALLETAAREPAPA